MRGGILPGHPPSILPNSLFSEPLEARGSARQQRVPAAPEGDQQPVHPQGGKKSHNQDRARAGVGARRV